MRLKGTYQCSLNFITTSFYILDIRVDIIKSERSAKSAKFSKPNQKKLGKADKDK